MTQKLSPARIIPPYNILLRSIIAKFAEESGIDLDTLNDLKNEQMAITEELATKIHLALDDDSPSVEFWLTLQSNYEGHKLEDFQKKMQIQSDIITKEDFLVRYKPFLDKDRWDAPDKVQQKYDDRVVTSSVYAMQDKVTCEWRWVFTPEI